MDAIDNDYDEIAAALALQSKFVQKNAEIVTPAMMGCDYSLRIDRNVPKTFIPKMPRSAMNSENDSCARVCVAATLLGCYVGFSRGENDVIEGSVQWKGEKDNFLGGYTISRLDFKHALKPGVKLVPDAELTEELWLVSYNKATLEYKPNVIGKMFVSDLTYLPVSGRRPNLEIVFFVENNSSDDLILSKEVSVPPASYSRVKVNWPSVYERSISNGEVSVVQVDKSVYEEKKKLVANFLNRHSDAVPGKPRFFSW